MRDRCHLFVSTNDPNWPKDLELSNVEGVGFALLRGHPGAIERLMPGSTAEKLIGHAECPVLVVRN